MKTLEHIYREIRAFGTRGDMDTILACAKLFAPLHEQAPYQNIDVARDIPYGAHERQILDIYQPANTENQNLPVFLFLHGGSFVGGDKHRPGTPYNDNVGVWTARNHMVGVVMNYRLAPQHPYPAGAEDVDSALAWLRDNISRYRGDPNAIIVLGTSAGANHVATCIALPQLSHSQTIKGAILMSCIYDITQAEKNANLCAYFGNDVGAHADKGCLDGMVNSDIPLLITLAEHEAQEYENQCLLYINTYFEKHQRWPNFYRVMNHNHFTSTQHMNSGDNVFGQQVVSFIQSCLAADTE